MDIHTPGYLLARLLQAAGARRAAGLCSNQALKTCAWLLQQLRTSEGLEALLEQVGASLAPGKQQALQVSRDHSKYSAEDSSGAGPPIRVSSSPQRVSRMHRCPDPRGQL